MILVTLVVFLFLQNWRATLIPMIAVPVSLVGTFAAFPMLADQHAVALRPGPRSDWSSTTRSWSWRRSSITSSRGCRRARPRPGDERGLGAGHRHRADPRLGLRAGGVHGRHPGAIEQAVRRDDCDLRAHLGLQRADLSPALPRAAEAAEKSKGVFARFFGGFNRLFEKATRGYINWSHALIRKAAIGVLIVALFMVVDGVIGKRLPTSFLPEEDYGYAFLNVQLPAPASLERTDQVLKKVEGILGKTEG